MTQYCIPDHCFVFNSSTAWFGTADHWSIGEDFSRWCVDNLQYGYSIQYKNLRGLVTNIDEDDKMLLILRWGVYNGSD